MYKVHTCKKFLYSGKYWCQIPLHLLNRWRVESQGVGISAQDLSLSFRCGPPGISSLELCGSEAPLRGRCWSQPAAVWRAQRVSLWTTVQRVATELVLVTVVFHLGHGSGRYLSLEVQNQKMFHLGGYSGKKNKFPRLLKPRGLLSQHKFLGADSISDKFRGAQPRGS